MKKYLPVIFASVLTVNTLTGCAGRNSPSEQNNAARQNNKSVIHQTAALADKTSSPGVSYNASASYEKLTAYKTKNYQQQSVADFNAMLASTPDELTEFLAAQADVISAITPDDENYDFFTTTMSFSSDELYCEHMGEESTLFLNLSKNSRPCSYLDEDGETVYDFSCFADLQAAYTINSPKLVTVAERDKRLLTFKEKMQNYLNGLSEEEIMDGNLKKMLIKKSAKLADNLSDKNMKISPCELFMLDIINAGEAEN